MLPQVPLFVCRGFGLASSYSSIDVSLGQTDFVSDLINFTPAEAFVGSGC